MGSYVIVTEALRSVRVRVALVAAKAPWFYEIADALVDAFVEKGVDAVLVVGTVDALQARWSALSTTTWIVLTPECFDALPPRGAIAYNFEQLDARATTSAHPSAIAHLVRVCRGAHALWDFSARNRAFWAAHGLAPVHVPLGFSPKMAYNRPIARDADACLFIGNVYGRRGALVEALRARLGAHRFHVVSDAFCYGDPYAEGDDASDDAKAAVLAGARLVVNLKPVDPALTCLETPRLWWCVANHVFVVSERDDDHAARAPFEAAGAARFVETARLVETVAELMAEPRATTRARARAACAWLARNERYSARLPPSS